MPENEKYIYYLLSQYITGKITQVEKVKLKELLLLVDDDLLTFYIYQIWEEFEIKEKPDPQIIKEMFAEIKRQTYPPVIFLQIKKLLRIAAVLVIPLISILSIYLFNQQIRHQYELLTAREISVETLYGQQIAVDLPDGTKVRLNVGSVLTYKQDYGIQNRSVNFTGEGYFEIVSDKAYPFVLHTQDLGIKVLGTSFNLYSYDDEEFIELTLLTGKLEVSTLEEPVRTVIINPDEKVVYNRNANNLNVEKTDNRFETAWLRGDLVFRSTPLHKVMERLEKRYGMLISLYAPDLEKELFTGTLSGETVFDAIRILQSHFEIRYEVYNDRIYIISREK